MLIRLSPPFPEKGMVRFNLWAQGTCFFSEITDFAGMRSRQNAILLISQPSSSTNGCKFGEVVRVE